MFPEKHLARGSVFLLWITRYILSAAGSARGSAGLGGLKGGTDRWELEMAQGINMEMSRRRGGSPEPRIEFRVIRNGG